MKKDKTRSASGASKPCVVVLHEVWGPDLHIQGVCKQLRKLGFATAVPPLYRGYESLLTPRNIGKAMAAVWDLSLEERRNKKRIATELKANAADADVAEVLAVLYDQGFRDGMLRIVLDAVQAARERHGKVATLGFSLGGGLSLAAAARPGHPDAAVSYCGEPPSRQNLVGTAIPVLAVSASDDELMSPLMPRFVEVALEEGIDLTIKIIPGTHHDFFNEAKKERYNRAAAEEAWDITAWFLTKTLRPKRSLSKK